MISKSYRLYDFICGAALYAVIPTPLLLVQGSLLEILFCTASGKGNREHCCLRGRDCLFGQLISFLVLQVPYVGSNPTQPDVMRSSSVKCFNICSLCGYHLLVRKLRVILVWQIPISAERRRVSFFGLLAIVASTCVDVPSSATVFGLRDLLPLPMDPVLLNFMISFVMGYLRSVRCIESTCYMTGGTTPSQQNNANLFFFRNRRLFPIVSPSSKRKRN
ncbi:hypothetical protein AVEN_228107-1 [Araneus ventricosus]|uniref:Uncharacterized protein n=1 Tax=Araneus ventricosus TaxID=182803 RepID=A0A4Y2HS85_ARAVE|nr:hypothetical protein AVEN_228107-1 [Araneus ventricosus]